MRRSALEVPLPTAPATTRAAMRRPGAWGIAALVAPLILFATLGTLSVRSSLQARAAADEAGRAQQALTELAGLQSVLTSAELQRGAGSGADGTLPDAVPTLKAQSDAHMAALRDLLSSDAEQYARLVALGPLLARRFDAPGAAGALRQRGGAAGSAGSAASPADSQRQQERLRSALGELRSTVQAAVPAAQARSASASRWAVGSSVAAALAALLLTTLSWLALQRSARQSTDALARQQAIDARQHTDTQTLQRLLAMAPDAICSIDAEGRLRHVNPACERLWGRPAVQLLRLPCTELVVPEDRRRTEQALDAAMASVGAEQGANLGSGSGSESEPAASAGAGAAPITWRARCRRPDGHTLQLAWTAAPLADGQGVLCVLQDHSAQEQAQLQQAQQAEALNQARAQADRADARAASADGVKAALLATVGPALRVPVDAIIASGALLQQGLAGGLGAEQQRQVALVNNQARRLLRVVNDMLDIARLEAGTLSVAREPFDLWESIQTVAATVRSQAADKGLKLELDTAQELGYARGDAARFEQILLNLLDNAVRCTPAGSIRLQAAPQPDGTLRIAVVDSGVGIDEAGMQRLFQPFAQGGGRVAGADTGAGLGLAVSQRLARLMGGSITASSTPGQGSSFVLTLPADAIAQQ